MLRRRAADLLTKHFLSCNKPLQLILLINICTINALRSRLFNFTLFEYQIYKAIMQLYGQPI